MTDSCQRALAFKWVVAALTFLVLSGCSTLVMYTAKPGAIGQSVRYTQGVATFSGSNRTTVYDPASGLLAGAAVGGVTALGVQQIAYDAKNQEQYANSILQANTVEPMQVVTGDLVLKGCCDPYPKADDLVRFEVTARGKTSVFEFLRAKVTQ